MLYLYPHPDSAAYHQQGQSQGASRPRWRRHRIVDLAQWNQRWEDGQHVS